MEAVAHKNYKRSATGRGGDISVREWARERGCGLRIARNHTGFIFKPNNEYWKQSRAKIIKGALPEGPRILECVNGRAKEVVVSELCEIAWVAYLGQITNIGSSRAQKLKKERSRECRDISVCEWVHEIGCSHGIARNRTGSIFRPNNE